MKSFFWKRIFLSAACIAAVSCQSLLENGNAAGGTLSVSFGSIVKSSDIPDTSDFILRIADASGRNIYDGRYGDAPERFSVEAGSYTVTAISTEFETPAFDYPQFGDSRTVVVPAGENVNAILDCTQTNCGLKLELEWSFLSEYPDAELFLRSAEGTLAYGYNETRTAFFKPGNVKVMMKNSGILETLCTKFLEPREICRVKISASGHGTVSADGGGIEINLDTLRNWSSEQIEISPDKDKPVTSDEYSVAEASLLAGETDISVCGYIVGGDLSSTRCSFKGPFSSNTNFVIADSATENDRSRCMSVQLAKGDIRNALNLVDNEGNLGRRIVLTGDIVGKYYGIPGIQNISGWHWKK